MFQEQVLLRIPGPTPLPPQVERAMNRPITGHRSGEFSRLFAETAERLKLVFQTQQDVLILAGSGTAGLEAAVCNVVSPGDKVLVLCGGNFGERFVKICKAYGANVLEVEASWGDPIDPELVAATLAEHPDVKAVFATHCETSTGVLHPIREIARRVQATAALLIVDAVSSLGAVDLPMDDWGLDIVVTGSQKALMLPPGLTFLALSERAWDVVANNRTPRFYFDLRAYKKQLQARTTPYTPAVSLLYGLDEVLKLIEAEGLPRIFDRHLLLQKMTRRAVQALELPLFTTDEAASPTVTSVGVCDFDVEKLRQALRTAFNLSVAGGQQHLKGQIFRIGHMGYCSPADVLQTIALLEVGLFQAGAPVALGRGVRAAQEVYLTHKEAVTHG
ncbi:aspartate aminotransferase-like enzyme [Tumebacillus sp. BK434]|uniref:pyridoxal-phosphate-dependent aminotransferase family protein n=1 Tax=Tumebacillus sp. BK434 TaxID=2512169 RepID=UPI0010443556|nr:alanine--glyoxylate aminotransferase family protein [Tumebacillus sp. BK434]TCP56001.1 aspartate aminotransferase-like enzyme [Tumebacillus sp. BK434]